MTKTVEIKPQRAFEKLAQGLAEAPDKTRKTLYKVAKQAELRLSCGSTPA